MLVHLLYLFVHTFSEAPERPPTPAVPLAFDLAREQAFATPPPLTAELLVAPAAAPRDPKPYDPAPLWLDRLSAAWGARANYLVRGGPLDRDGCDGRDMRCARFHEDLAHVDPTDASAAITASALGSALGFLVGGGDRPLLDGLRLRGKARFVGVVGEF